MAVDGPLPDFRDISGVELRAKEYELQYRRQDTPGDWSRSHVFPATGDLLEMPAEEPGDYEFRIRCIPNVGQPSEWVYGTKTIVGINQPPPAPVQLDVVPGTDHNLIKVTLAAKLKADQEIETQWTNDLAGSPHPDNWVTLAEGKHTESKDTYETGALRWYRARTIDYQGNTSTWTTVKSGRAKTAEDGATVGATQAQIDAINQALADAAAAQETADGAVVAFYDDVPPSGGGEKFGDVFIDLNAEPFTAANAGYRFEDVNGGSAGVLDWRLAPNNALVKLYFDAYNAQTTADGKIKTFFVATVAALPDPALVTIGNGDLCSVEENGAIYRWNGAAWEVRTARNVADGADVSTPSQVGVKKNFNSFTNPNAGELYIHGFTAAGTPADVDGRIYHDGAVIPVPRGKISTHVIAEGWIVFDTALTEPFASTDGGAEENLGFCVKEGSGWKYDNNSELVPFTPTDDMIVIGTCVTDAVEHVSSATAWSHAIALGAITFAGADRTADEFLGLTNGLVNPECEAGDTGWGSTGPWEITKDAVNARQGSWAMKLSATADVERSNDKKFQVFEGDRILAFGFFKRVSGSGHLQIKIRWEDENGGYVSQTLGNEVSGSSYAMSRALGSAPAGAVRASINVRYAGGDGTATVGWADGFGAAIFPKNADIDALETTNGPAEAGADQTTGKGTTVLVDDAGLGNTANWAGIEEIPDTLAGVGITDGQKDLGPSSDDLQVLHRDIGGSPYWADKYDEGLNGGVKDFLETTVTLANTSYVQVGSTLSIPNPGRYVAVQAVAAVVMNHASGSSEVRAKIEVSFDGGVTWSGSGKAGRERMSTSVDYATLTFIGGAEGIPTDDIHIRVVFASISGASVTLSSWSRLSYAVFPRSASSLLSGPLAVNVPTTRSGSCDKDYPSTTCTAAATVTATATGGAGSYDFAWSKVSGTDSITSGATAETCTVSGTHTTDTPADSYQTTVKCTVTDADSDVASSGNCVVTLSYLRTYAPVHVITPDEEFGCTRSTGLPCTAEGELSRSVTGGDGDYTDSWVKTGGDGTLVSGATTPTPTVSHNAVTEFPQVFYFGTFRDTVMDGRGASDQDSSTVTFRHTGT